MRKLDLSNMHVNNFSKVHVYFKVRTHPAISRCGHLLLKMKSGYNDKIIGRWLKNYIQYL